MQVHHIVIILFMVVSCATKSVDPNVYLDVSNTRILLDGVPVSRAELEKQCRMLRDNKMDQGIKPDQIIFNLYVDPHTKRGVLADIEVIMRKMNIRRINYFQPEKKKSP